MGDVGWSLVMVAIFIYVCLGIADVSQRLWNWVKRRYHGRKGIKSGRAQCKCHRR
jgi:hypothetical protein